MIWLVFLLLAFAWFFSLALARENPSWIRKTLYVFFTFTLGSQLFLGGLDFPNGMTSVVTGSTTTQTINYIHYNAAITGSNAQPILFGIGLGLFLYGIFGLVLIFIDSFAEVQRYRTLGKTIVWPWDKKGV